MSSTIKMIQKYNFNIGVKVFLSEETKFVLLTEGGK